jgi:hypothetical protein
MTKVYMMSAEDGNFLRDCALCHECLFDHLVSKREQLVRHLDAERLRGFEIDDEFKFRGLLNGKV